MNPAFRSASHASAFAATCGALLALPLILGAIGRPTPQECYRAVRETGGPFAWDEKAIFVDRGDVDMAVIGSSYLWAAFDTPYMKEELSQALGREATVITLASNWRGEDMVYVLLRDLVAHRKVKTIVLSMATATSRRDEPHPMAHRFLAMGHGSEAMAGLPLKSQAQLYGDFVLGAPRHALDLLRPSPREDPPVFADRFGATLNEAGFQGAPFVAVSREPPALPPEELIYDRAHPERTAFRFSGEGPSAYEEHFARLTSEIARANGIQVVLVHVPVWEEQDATTIDERFDWGSGYGFDRLVGVAPARLFAGLSKDEVNAFYYTSHLNKNGARLFTSAIAPALIALHVRGSAGGPP